MTHTVTIEVAVHDGAPDTWTGDILTALRQQEPVVSAHTLAPDHGQCVTVESLDEDVIDNPRLTDEQRDAISALPHDIKRAALDRALSVEDDRYFAVIDGIRAIATNLLVDEIDRRRAAASLLEFRQRIVADPTLRQRLIPDPEATNLPHLVEAETETVALVETITGRSLTGTVPVVSPSLLRSTLNRWARSPQEPTGDIDAATRALADSGWAEVA